MRAFSHRKRRTRIIESGFLACVVLLSSPPASGGLPVTGVSVPELSWTDDLMVDYMMANNISGGVLGIMKDGCVVYQRGFGWHDEALTIAMPENALVRLASCTKPITAAAIRKLEASTPLFTLSDFVFDLGQPLGGIINITPYQPHDPRLEDITVQHCLSHRAGWDRTVEDDYAQRPCETAPDLGIPSPPGIDNTISWILGQPLHFDPDDHTEYSNAGYLVLGKVVEIEAGMDVVTYHRAHVLTPSMWVPATDLQLGRTFAADQPPREAWYAGTNTVICVFPRWPLPGCHDMNLVIRQYGGWDHAAYEGFGGLIASAATMLELAERYYLRAEDPDIGIPLTGRVNSGSGGAFDGTCTYVCQRSDGANVFIFFNKAASSNLASDFYVYELKGLLDLQTNWPTTCIDGFWVNPDGGTPSVYGSFRRPFAGLDDALATVVNGSRVNFKPGTSSWTGTISTRLQLRAPLGTVTIGDVP